METAFCVRVVLCRAPQQLSLQSIQLRLPPALPSVVDGRERFTQHGEPFSDLASSPTGLSEEGKIIRISHLSPCGLQSGQALAHLLHALRSPSLLAQRPALHDRRPRCVVCKPLLLTERKRCLYPRLDGVPLPPKLMDHSSIIQGQSQ